jgi:hypothetical protein
VSVLLLSTARSGRTLTRLVLDGVMVAASWFLLAWVTVMEGVFHA